MKTTYTFLLLIFIITSCQNNTSTSKKETAVSFYYWKNSYELSNYLQQKLDDYKTKKLYLKVADIVNINGINKPLYKIKFYDEPNKSLQYIPCFYIRKECFNVKDTTLAASIILYLNSIEQLKNYTEIQIDCDWTPAIKENYFSFLNQIKQLSKKTISATLRLYPYAYSSLCGIPPVDTAVLMCYHTSDLKNSAAQNSILNLNDLTAYLKQQKKYPLPIKLALPIFNWQLVYNSNKFIRISYNTQLNLTNWVKNGNLYTCIMPYYDSLANYNYNNLNTIKAENIDAATLIQTKSIVNKYIPNISKEILLFALDSTWISKYEYLHL
jgi:hypothetical protein